MYLKAYRHLITAFTVLSIFSFTINIGIPVSGLSIDNIRIENLELVDASRQQTKQVEVGQQVAVRATVKNNVKVDQTSVVLIEVRDGSGITEYLAWQNVRIGANSNYTFETSWLAERGCIGAPAECNGSYQVRSWAFTSFVDPELLGGVTTLEGIAVIESNGSLAYRDTVSITIQEMKDVYHVNEPISFTVHTKGASDNLCNDPKVNVGISSTEDGTTVWSTPITFQTAMLCGNTQGIDKEWRFGYEGEQLPYQSALIPSPYQENSIAIEQPGKYTIVAEFDEHIAEKDFQVASSDSGISVTGEVIKDSG